MKLEKIGFYTLSDERADTATHETPLQRCELILTGRCNFSCPYCRKVGGPDLELGQATRIVVEWGRQGLKNIRFSGGEPTLYKELPYLVKLAKSLGIERIAVSTNGSSSVRVYDELLAAGVNDFSVSLDACCAEDGDKMAGGVKGSWEKVVDNIRYLSSKTYVTVGVVLTSENVESAGRTIQLAHGLGVADIRIIPAAQDDDRLKAIQVDDEVLRSHPILRYRIRNIQQGCPVRGIDRSDTTYCSLVLDDMAVMGDKHYPCIIYMRENGSPIGEVGKGMRQQRLEWFRGHDTHKDPICKKNCLDVCVQFNNRSMCQMARNKKACILWPEMV